MKRKFTVNSDAFNTATYERYNNAIVTEVLDTKTNEHVEGRSGTTKAYDTAQGGRLFLHEEQVTLVG